MKRLLLVSFALVATWQNVFAYDFKVGELYYNIISSADLTVEVTSQYDSWHEGNLFYYYKQGYIYSNVFRSGYYDYYDYGDWDVWSYEGGRSNHYEDQERTIHTPCTDPYENVIIPATITHLGITFNVVRIGDHAFYGCRYLTNINIPSTISSIGDSAFSGCIRLSTISLSNMSTISKKCFAGCSLLGRVYVSDPINTIEDSAFVGCTHLTSFQLNNAIPPIVGTNAINSIPAYASIYVPCASISAYQQNPSWNIFSHFYGVGAAGDLNLSVNDTLRGSITITDTADCDNPATILANANYGYHFASWNDGVTVNPRTFTIEYDTSFTAIFDKNKYYVGGSSANIVMGSVAGSDSAMYLDTVTLLPMANYGYQFSQWSDGNTNVPRRVAATEDIALTAYFDSALFSLQTLSNNEQMGFTRINSNEYLSLFIGNYKYLSTQILYAIPTENNQFMEWSDGIHTNPRTVTLYGDTSFMAVFAPKYVLTVLSDNETMGTVTGSGLFANGGQAVVSAEANYGYHFVNWNDGITTATRTVSISSDTTFTAYFARNQYTVTAVSANPNWGSVSGSANALYGDSITLSATTIGQHHFTYWSDGENQYTNNPLRIRVTKNDYYTANFAVNQYQAVVITDGGGSGYMGTEGTTNSGYYDYLSQITIRAVPYPGNRFVSWSDGCTFNPRAITITNDTSFTAQFVADLYTIVAASADTAMGDATGTGVYLADSIVTIAAIPNHGFKFDHWQDNNTSNPRLITVSTNQSFIAYFSTYDTVIVHDTTLVDFYIHDTTYITLTDTVTNTVYDTITNTVFDTITNTIYDTTVVYSTDTLWLHDTVFVHDTIFIYDTIYVGVDEVETVNAKIYTSNGQIVVDGAECNTVWLYDVNGRVLATKHDEYSPLRFDVPASGAYLVKIGNHPARKVVVIR